MWLVAFINAEADIGALTILDRAAENLDGIVNVAVVDYVMTDWKMRQSWTVTPALVPQLRLFHAGATTAEATTTILPKAIPGLEPEPGVYSLADLPEVSLKGRAWAISHAVSQTVENHRQGNGAKLKTKRTTGGATKQEL
eukprot:SAG22_NODE_95_length_20791_cov_40.318514_1_plen_140_part_00